MISIHGSRSEQEQEIEIFSYTLPITLGPMPGKFCISLIKSMNNADLVIKPQYKITEIEIGTYLPLIGKYFSPEDIRLEYLEAFLSYNFSKGTDYGIRGIFKLSRENIEFKSTAKRSKAALSFSDLNISEPEGSGVWLDIQKSIGPINLQRIGIDFIDDMAIKLIIDAGINSSILSINLIDLSFTAPLLSLDILSDISASLRGLDVSLNTEVLGISGNLLKVGNEQYDGRLAVKAGKFSLTALGSYATYNNQTSLFAFAVIDYPLGGPPCFFITGGAASFGYNRNLKLPTIETVGNFSLIRAAFSPSEFKNKIISTLVKDMGQDLPVEIGQYFIAAGVKFTSFQLITGFALATVTFGNRLEVALLGIADLLIGESNTIIAEIELVIKARFAPEEGVVSLEAQLTDNSYLLSRDCKLTGGFAFYLWYGASKYSGDFVITLGGYHPYFKKPDYYPSIKPLGCNWIVNNNFYLKGELYFALTPVCVMAGGSLTAMWHSDSIKAWFHLYLDMLIAWKPYHYDIEAGVSIGVSVDCWLTTITVEVGADLHIWGPDFTGLAKIHLWIVSFTIEFGEGASQEIAPLKWEEFEKAFLFTLPTNPQYLESNVNQSIVTSVQEASADKVCGINIINGLIKEEGEFAVVDPEHLQFATSSLLPSKEAKFNNKSSYIIKDSAGKERSIPLIDRVGQEYDTTHAPSNTDFGVGLVQVPHSEFHSSHIITLVKESTSEEVPIEHIEPIAVRNKISKSLWSNINITPNNNGLKSEISKKETTIDNVFTGLNIGFALNVPDKTLPIDLKVLLLSITVQNRVITYTNRNILPANNFSPADDVLNNISRIGSNSKRKNFLDLLAASNPRVRFNEINLAQIASSVQNSYFIANPTLSHLGGEKQ